MSSDGRTVGRSDRNIPAPTASVHPTRPTVRPTVRLSDLGSIAHPPDPIARVVGDQQGAVRRDHEPDRAPPARSASRLLSHDYLLTEAWVRSRPSESIRRSAGAKDTPKV